MVLFGVLRLAREWAKDQVTRSDISPEFRAALYNFIAAIERILVFT
jgi:hypothetical protein